jgi:hypothetical protein
MGFALRKLLHLCDEQTTLLSDKRLFRQNVIGWFLEQEFQQY